MRFVDRGAEARQAAPPVVRLAFALEHRERHRLDALSCGKRVLIWKVRASLLHRASACGR